MKEENLPQIKKENIITKIRNWFLNLIHKSKANKEEIKNLEKLKQAKDSFKEKIKAESNEEILRLQIKLKEKQVEISTLTDEELDEMIDLYKKQIEEKENKLKQYMMKIA